MSNYFEDIRNEIKSETDKRLFDVALAESIMAKSGFEDFKSFMDVLNDEIRTLESKYDHICNAKHHADILKHYEVCHELDKFLDFCEVMLRERNTRYKELTDIRESMRKICKHEKDKYNSECKICKEYMRD